MAIDIEKRRARWRRNKREERFRAVAEVVLVDPVFRTLVIAERDRRVELAAEGAGLWRRAFYFKRGTLEHATEFLADVWAEKTLIEAERGKAAATPTRIASRLGAADKGYGYTEASLRKMVYRALERVELLERTDSLIDRSRKIWPRFELTIGKIVV